MFAGPARRLALALETGSLDVSDYDQMGNLLFGAMAADPAIGALAFLYPDGGAVIADRMADPARSYRADYAADAGGRHLCSNLCRALLGRVAAPYM